MAPTLPSIRAANTAVPEALAFIVIETTGPEPYVHDLLELAVVRVDPRTLAVQSEFHTFVALETEGPSHREVESTLGMSTFERTGTPLREALTKALPLLAGAALAGHHVDVAWRFLQAEFAKVGLPQPIIDSRRLDTASLGWPLVASGELAACGLGDLTRHFGVDGGDVVGALAEAHCVLDVARRLLLRQRLGGRLAGLAGDEADILEVLLTRMSEGRRQYGPWHVSDRRHYPTEAYAEVLDALHYVAAEIVRLRRRDESRMRRVYVCLPFGRNAVGHRERAERIARQLVAEGALPIAPHLTLPAPISSDEHPDAELSLRLELVGSCDELRVFGGLVTPEQRCEVERANARGIPVRFEREVRP